MQPLSIPCIAMALVNFCVGAFYLYFSLKRPQIREHLPFALLCFSFGFYDVFSAGLYNSSSVPDGVFWQRLQLDTGITIYIFWTWFISVFTHQKDNRIIQFSIAWFLVVFFVMLFVSPELSLSPANPAVKNINLLNFLSITYYEGVVGLVYQVGILSAVIVNAYLFYLLIHNYRKTRYKPLLLILACQIIYYIVMANDTLVAMQVYSFIYIAEYSFFFLVLAMAYTLLDRFVNVSTEFEELTVNLERKVNERTTEIEELNEHLKHLVDRDGLTGVYNRRFFNEYFEIEVRRAMNFLEHKARLVPNQESDMNFGLAMIDIDRFKQINDTCGHVVGDNVLKQVIEIIEGNIFSRDVLCRYGGDEFALLLTKTSNSGILQAAEKIRKEIDEHAFLFGADHERQHVTISVGLVIFDEVLNKDSDEILKLADNRLLRAKSKGKNRIVYDDAA
jgi:diguanylate cyclase (GGDEF)-like protein